MSAVPTKIGKYVVSGLIGRGGMGAVYRGTDPLLGRPVAIKVLHDPSLAEGEVQQRFLQEARAAASLRHESIVTVYEVGEHDGFTYVAMEFVDGESLSAILRKGKSLPLHDVLGWIDQLCSGLSLAHDRGVIHRDIKPANLMVDERGVLRILDFGIARVEGSTMTTEGSLIGTLNYMSPEQVLGQRVDHRSDIFAVAATAYELVTGQQAFPGSAATAIQRVLNVEPPAPASIRHDLPAGLNEIIARGLAKDPSRRFADLREMQRQVRAVRDRLDRQVAIEKETSATEPATVLRPVEPTRLTPRPTERAPVDDLTVVKVASPASLLFGTTTAASEETPTPPEAIDEPRRRWSPRLAIGAAAIAVAVIAVLLGLFAGGIWPSETGPPRPDLASILEHKIAPAFAADVRQHVFDITGVEPVEGGMWVNTTLDPALQGMANAALADWLQSPKLVEGALVAIENRTGKILALVGGSGREPINFAAEPRRIGSLFMPVIYTAAIDRGLTAVSIKIDEPTTFQAGPGMPPFSPENDDGAYRGEITLRRALEESRNVVAAKLMDELGTFAVRPYAQRLGLPGDLASNDLPMAAGLEATLLEVTSGYATLANQGIRMEPHFVVSASDRQGITVIENRPTPDLAVRSDTAFIVTSMLMGVIQRGTGAAARSLEWTLAGKTGTVPDGTDGWFVGYDPNITVGVWVGREDKRPIGTKEAASSTALSIWIEFMKSYISARGDRQNAPGFEAPTNIVYVPVGDGVVQPFIAGTQPDATTGK